MEERSSRTNGLYELVKSGEFGPVTLPRRKNPPRRIEDILEARKHRTRHDDDDFAPALIPCGYDPRERYAATRHEDTSLAVHYQDEGAAESLASFLLDLLPANRPIVYLCIGTDRATGDCLGPLVGTGLRQRGIATVVGHLHDAVHASNLHRRWDDVQQVYPDAFVLAIDAAIARSKAVGTLSLRPRGMRPGTGLGRKDLPHLGHASLTGTTQMGSNSHSLTDYLTLASTRLSIVWDMAEVICRAIALVQPELTKRYVPDLALEQRKAVTIPR